jgi:hypothetical protein
VSRFPLNFKTDRKLHLRALPLRQNVAHLNRKIGGVWLSFSGPIAAAVRYCSSWPSDVSTTSGPEVRFAVSTRTSIEVRGMPISDIV